ncbi:monocarboxylate transporter 9 [Cucumis melo var. makuwa]|uniref:Monocarboxylate transporter 9 n=2 Tax=Cucumis melo TaxID=3656 RepID=A0A5A7URK2_CUCMM|nr:monocarboxylate transporter 9 [Cucumis melo var. makuwa]TYJ98472.1 monocarboxylate transporter 9 [Cucumis melo var. makuwa]
MKGEDSLKAVRELPTYPTSERTRYATRGTPIKCASKHHSKARSRAVRTERTILSPFTKEYRVLAAYSGIRLFLEGFLYGEAPIS